MTIGAARATYDDVNLVIKLYELRRDDRMRDARRWFGASFHVKTLDQFNALCPIGSEPNEFYRMVVTYWDMVASFLTSGVVNQELFFQSGGEMIFVWERVRDVLPQMRATLRESAAAEEPGAGRGGVHPVVEQAGARSLRRVQQAHSRVDPTEHAPAETRDGAHAPRSRTECRTADLRAARASDVTVPPSARSKVARARAKRRHRRRRCAD